MYQVDYSLRDSMMPSTATSPAPQLTDNDFVRAVCGLRPCRYGGLRLETESLNGQQIVHHYGHGGCGVTIGFGTTEIVLEQVKQIAESSEQIAVLGGGVVGLITARALARRGHQVTIYAHKFAHDTTSVLAGALWLPVGVEFGTSQQKRIEKDRILRTAWNEWNRLDRDIYGIELLDVYEPKGTSTEEGLFAPGLIEEPQPIDTFPFPAAAQPDRSFRTFFIHTPKFLDALIHDLDCLGVKRVHTQLRSHTQLTSLEERVIINCTALGSMTLFGDDAIYPARGVLVHMRAQNLGYCVHDGYKYMFPREDALILGGCFQPNREDDRPDEQMIAEIIDHHRRFFGSACGVE
jgi:D-amino-acid oxidase